MFRLHRLIPTILTVKQAMRDMHHAQAEALAKLINRIEQLAAAPPAATGANGQPIDAAASPRGGG